MKTARIYLRVSSNTQELDRQEKIVTDAKRNGYYVAGVYKEKASGARADRPELIRMIGDLQPGDVVIAEKMDRISRLPLPEAENLIDSIKGKGALLAIPGVVDLSDVVSESDGVSKIVLESIQELLLKLSLQMARDDYEDRRERQKQGIAEARKKGRYTGRSPDTKAHELIVKLRSTNTISETARIVGCSESQVKRVMRLRKNNQ